MFSILKNAVIINELYDLSDILKKKYSRVSCKSIFVNTLAISTLVKYLVVLILWLFVKSYVQSFSRALHRPVARAAS